MRVRNAPRYLVSRGTGSNHRPAVKEADTQAHATEEGGGREPEGGRVWKAALDGGVTAGRRSQRGDTQRGLGGGGTGGWVRPQAQTTGSAVLSSPGSAHAQRLAGSQGHLPSGPVCVSQTPALGTAASPPAPPHRPPPHRRAQAAGREAGRLRTDWHLPAPDPQGARGH